MSNSTLENILMVVIVVGWLTVLIFLISWFLRTKLKKWFKFGARAKTIPVQPMSNKPVLLTMEIPKENDKTPQAAETLFSSLHGIGDNRLSFELEAKEKSIRFYVWTTEEYRGYIEGQLYAQYPDVNILEAKDYSNPNQIPDNLSAVSMELDFRKEDFYPIKTFDNFSVDPLAAITATLSKLGPDDHIWTQLVITPESDDWREKAINFISAVKEGKLGSSLGASLSKKILGFGKELITTAVTGGEEAAKKEEVKLPPGMEVVLKAIEEKSSNLGFRTKIRMVVMSQNLEVAKSRLQLAIGAFKQFNTNNLNSFVAGKYSENKAEVLSTYHQRAFTDKGLILNVTELASIYHLPNENVQTPNIIWAGSKKGEPPANLPLASTVSSQDLTNLATTNFRGSQEKFGIKLKDRNRHMYIIGKSGTGKSTLLVNMTIDDIRERRGTAVIDPHGDYVNTVLEYIPSYRANDVIVFDPGDRDFPIAINMLEVKDPKYKVVVASGVVGIFKKIFGNSWGPRLEYWLSSAIMALLDYPDATLMMVPRMFTEKTFRNKVIEKVQDPLIKNRWLNEYNKLDQRQQNETISPILNKVGQFLSSPVIRNIVGQPKSSIDFRKVMDEEKILLVKLAKGIIGEDNAALLGAMIITQIQLASMTRADIPEEERKRFYLYVDEFQNFATESFQTILSESRKYRLSLTLANQYMDQLIPEVRDAIFGNVNTIISFRVGGADAEILEKEFAPVFEANDLVNLSMFNIYIKLSIDNLTTNAFSAQTLPLPSDRNGIQDKIVKLSREQYAKSAEFVESKIAKSLEEAKADQEKTDKKYTKPFAKQFSNYKRDNLPNRPVPYRPGENRSYPKKYKSNNSRPARKSRPANDSLLKKVISNIESKKPWVPPEDNKKPNPINDLNQDQKRVNDQRRQSSQDRGIKENEWTSLDIDDSRSENSEE